MLLRNGIDSTKFMWKLLVLCYNFRLSCIIYFLSSVQDSISSNSRAYKLHPRFLSWLTTRKINFILFLLTFLIAWRPLAKLRSYILYVQKVGWGSCPRYSGRNSRTCTKKFKQLLPPFLAAAPGSQMTKTSKINSMHRIDHGGQINANHQEAKKVALLGCYTVGLNFVYDICGI